jgi:hypothetical protein
MGVFLMPNFSLRLPDDLAARVKALAESEERSASQVLARLVRAGLASLGKLPAPAPDTAKAKLKRKKTVSPEKRARANEARRLKRQAARFVAGANSEAP